MSLTKFKILVLIVTHAQPLTSCRNFPGWTLGKTRLRKNRFPILKNLSGFPKSSNYDQ